MIEASIDDNDRDALVGVKTLHVTLLVLRLRSEEDLPKWKKIISSLKLRKIKLNIRGVGIFPVKPGTNYTKYFYAKVDGLSDVIDDLVQKSIGEGLMCEKDLSHIKFDKKTDMF